MTIEEKAIFLSEQFIPILRNLQPAAKGNWGVMNGQQMVEHFSDSVRIANGKDKKKILTPAEHLQKYYDFAMSEKPFKENTKNIELSEIPPPPKFNTLQESLNELQNEIKDFFLAFESNPDKKITNPFFGDLNFEEWVQLLHKHAIHHLKQFSLI